MSGRFQLQKSSDGQFRFRLLAGNGQLLLTGGPYPAYAAALNGIDAVRRNALREGAFSLTESAAGEHFCVLRAADGQLIGQSQPYASLYSAEQGCDAVRRNAPGAALQDESATPSA